MPSQNLGEKELMEITAKAASDPVFRVLLTRDSFYWFCHVYFATYIHYETAPFQREIEADLQDDSIRFLEILAFRDSAKTSIVSLMFVIWCIVTKRRRYPILVGDSGPQANRFLYNIRKELENNELLILDWGPFKPETAIDKDEWQKTTIVIPRYDARISVHTNGQNIRGIRHRDQRPDLVIMDDLENLKEVAQKAQRDKLHHWVKAEAMQVGALNTRYILLGNLLHSDGIMTRMEKEIKEGRINGVVRRYRIMENDSPGVPFVCNWPGKFPNRETLEAKRRELGEKVWNRECMLRVVPEDGQVVHESWIRKYRFVPASFVRTQRAAGVDLAISKKSTADFTGIVPAAAGIQGNEEEQVKKIYISKDIINERLSLNDMISKCQAIATNRPGIRFAVEAVQYQLAALEEMKRRGLFVDGVRPIADKRARLEAVAGYVKDGTVVFPEEGAEDLIIQLIGFGVEEHDDLCLDGNTMILCERGSVPIRDVTTDDRVMTRKGWRRVLWSGKTGKKEVIERIGIVGTKDHPVIIASGIKELQDINASDTIYAWNEKRLCIEEKIITDILNQTDDNCVSIFGGTTKTKPLPWHFIVRSTSTALERLIRVWSFTIKMITRLTTIQKILSAFLPASTCRITPRRQIELRNQGRVLRSLPLLQRDGTRAMKEENGIESKRCDQRVQGNSPEDLRPVYNLTIEDEHEFFANGILVHNCDAFTYLILSLMERGIGKGKVVWI